MTEEHAIQNKIRLALSEHGGCTFWRGNVATGWQGDITRLPDGSLLIKNPRPVQSGLPVGFSDLFGFVMINKIPVFSAIECKTPKGIVKPEQKAFIKYIQNYGGISGIARSIDDAIEIIKRAECASARS